MDQQPPEIILEQILKLDYISLNNLCSSNKRIKKVCNENKDYIYKKLIERDFGIKTNPEFLYKMFTQFKNEIPILDKSKHYDLLKENIKNENKFKKLLNYIDINVKNIDGQTILMYAFENSNLKITNRILDLNPDVNIKNKDGETILMLALKYRPELINRILSMNMDINVKNNNDFTTLMFALQYSTPEIINRILDLNAEINVKTKNNWTPLMYALEYSKPEIINRILDLNPEVNVKSKNGNTALELAIEKSTPEIIDRIKNML
jgi:ankyrin repeat protein